MDDKKFCKFCGAKIDKDCVVCPKCGRQLSEIKEEKVADTTTTPESIDKPKFYEQTWFMWVILVVFAPAGILFMWKFHPEMQKKTKIILTVVFGLLFLILVFTNTGDSTDNNTNNSSNYSNNNSNYSNNSSSESSKESSKPSKKTIGLEETFTFDDLEITLGKNISFATINNQFSDYNGQTAVKLPITVKNLKDETHGLNMFFYSVYGSKGTEVDTPSAYFDDSIDFAGDLRTGASYTKYLYFMYDGNGTYAIEFDDWLSKRTVEFTINK